MIKIFLTIIIFLFAGLTFSQMAKNDSYTLTIKKGKLKRQSKQIFYLIPTTLTNNSKDTLKYFSMSCSWQDFYSVNNKKLQIETAYCNKNFPIILALAPRQTKTVEIKLLVNQTVSVSEIKFRIGFNLMKASNIHDSLDFDFKKEQKRKKVIWSNLISI